MAPTTRLPKTLHWRGSWPRPQSRRLGKRKPHKDSDTSPAPIRRTRLVARNNSPQILAKFPPTLIITATRGFEMSGALYTHTQLVKYGVDAELHVWEARYHGFFYNPDVPESRDCYDVIVKFFDRHLGQRS